MGSITVRRWPLVAVACICVLVFFSYALFLRRTAHSLGDVIVVCDSRLSSTACAQITQEVRALSVWRAKAKVLLELLREKHPYLAGITLATRGAERIVSLMADSPVAILVPDLLITNQGHHTPCSVYTISVQDFLYQCVVPNKKAFEADAKDFAQWVRALPAWVREQYTCTWYNPTRIVLTSIKEPWILVVTKDTVLDAHLQQLLERVYQYGVERQKKEKRSKGKGWSVDARFAHRLILSRLKGEKGYEEDIAA